MSKLPATSLILVAAGTGSRMKTKVPKPFLQLQGRAIIDYTLAAFQACDWLCERIIVVSRVFLESAFGKNCPDLCRLDQESSENTLIKTFRARGVQLLVAGGASRHESVLRGLEALERPSSFVMIHDAVRPFVEQNLIEKVSAQAQAVGAAILALPVKDTVKEKTASNQVKRTLDRKQLVAVQTPQVFERTRLLRAYQQNFDHTLATDDASIFEQSGGEVALVPGDYKNIKITTPEDLDFAEYLLTRRNQRTKAEPA